MAKLKQMTVEYLKELEIADEEILKLFPSQRHRRLMGRLTGNQSGNATKHSEL